MLIRERNFSFKLVDLLVICYLLHLFSSAEGQVSVLSPNHVDISLPKDDKSNSKTVGKCMDDETCVFSWVCDRIGKPVRFCSGPFFYFTVCCKTKDSPEVSTTTEMTTTSTTTVTTTTPLPVTPAPPSLPAMIPKTCGKAPLIQRAARIVGGSSGQYGEFPYSVIISIKGQERCGGAILDRQWVVTAGHCVALSTISNSDVFIRFGVWDRTRVLFLGVEIRNVAKIIVHPEYNKQRSFANDIALLKLEFPIDFSLSVQPICLPSPGEDFSGVLGTITGWGRLQFKEERPAIMQRAEVRVMNNDECDAMFKAQKTPESIIPQMMCAGGGQQDACQGDSGGPMSIFRDGTYTLVGLISWGYGCALPGYPGVYTRISMFTSWLLDTMRIES